MIATIRAQKAQGNTALYVRVRDGIARYWDFAAKGWLASETAACKVFLTEYPDTDVRESRYQAPCAVPSGEVVVEYVRASDAAVIGEESVYVQATIRDLHDEAFGRWQIDMDGDTHVMYRPDGTVLKAFNLTRSEAEAAPIYVGREEAV